ncbi:hypothetical protein PHET_04216 [Paragonimus heterotremus]|uniref:MAM domain-containing protein n=1 Tax=Paragonimus heterotremus TaxID=100268 RepID=A0A8J4WIW1_9TREM|nr:hypothetical protein PHET_04216 [Paragonimus heterotremus]
MCLSLPDWMRVAPTAGEPLTARLWSPPIGAGSQQGVNTVVGSGTIRLPQCLTLSYLISYGKLRLSENSVIMETRQQRNEEKAQGNFPNSLLTCTFENPLNAFCGWRDDVNDWSGRWQLTPRPTGQFGKELCVGFINSPDFPEDTQLGLTARLWSPLIRLKKLTSSEEPKCLRLFYKIAWTHPTVPVMSSTSFPKLSLLMRRHGLKVTCCPSDYSVSWKFHDFNEPVSWGAHSKPVGDYPSSFGLSERGPPTKLDCDFSRSLCLWTNDQNNWPTNWAFSEPHVQSGRPKSLCLVAKSMGGSRSDLTARLFGPLLTATNSARCLRLTYAIQPNSVQAGPKLALLRRQMGRNGCVSRVNWLIPLSLRIAYLSELIATSVMVLATSFHGFSAPGMLDSIKPTLDCNFTGTTCYWANDPNNWPVNWMILQAVPNDVPKETAVCLDSKSIFPTHGDMDVSGRLFGPLVSSVNSPQCLQLHYRLVVGLPSEDVLTLSVAKLSGRRPSLALLPYSVDEPVTITDSADELRLLDCNFENQEARFCHWSVDPRDSHVVWSVDRQTDVDQSIACLRPLIPIGRRTRVLAHQEQDGPLTGRLWSRSAVLTDLVGDVHSSSVARCIRFAYRLQLTSGPHSLGTLQDRTDLVFPKLSLLRHSSG